MVSSDRMRGCQGSIPAVKKKRCAASHIASGGATTLKSSLSTGSGGSARWSRYEIARQSTATVTAPAAGPNTTALVSVNTSEMEKFTDVDGNLQNGRSAQERQAQK